MEYKVRELKLVHTWTISRSSDDVKNNVFVRFEKDAIAGIGEAAPSQRYNKTPESTIETIKKAEPLFEQYDPWHFVDLGYAIQRLVEEQTAAKCALDIALLDWITKKLQMIPRQKCRKRFVKPMNIRN